MKLFNFPPQPKSHLKRRATSKGRDSIYWNHHTLVIRWMGKNALRRITEYRKAAGRYPTVDELQLWISDHCTQARSYFDDYDRMTEDAAVFALSAYDEDEYNLIVRRASNGGKMSGHKKGSRGKRPPKFTTEQLQQHEHLSIAQQAEKLGCSPATIKRIRARLKAERTAEHEAELDKLFGPQEAAEPLSDEDADAVLASLDQPTPEPSTVPDHVPASWLEELAEEYRREAEARVTFADFAEIEI